MLQQTPVELRAADLLDRAAALVETKGWAFGSHVGVVGKGHCILSAIATTMGNIPKSVQVAGLSWTICVGAFYRQERDSVSVCIGKAYPAPWGKVGDETVVRAVRALGFNNPDEATSWNDEFGSKELVLDRLRRGAAQLREQALVS
jgi:hypothetical protein